MDSVGGDFESSIVNRDREMRKGRRRIEERREGGGREGKGRNGRVEEGDQRWRRMGTDDGGK